MRRGFKTRPEDCRKSNRSYELTEEAKEARDQSFMLGVDPANRMVYDPGKSKIPQDGAWVMITRQLPPMEHRLNKKVRVGRIFWVGQHEESDDFGFLFNGTYKVFCQTEWGSLWLWPYEYSPIEVESILIMWQADEIVFHPVNMELGRLNDIIYYARAKGISLQDATVMALGTIKGPVGWFEPKPELATRCESMEARVHRWLPMRVQALPGPGFSL